MVLEQLDGGVPLGTKSSCPKRFFREMKRSSSPQRFLGEDRFLAVVAQQQDYSTAALHTRM